MPDKNISDTTHVRKSIFKLTKDKLEQNIHTEHTEKIQFISIANKSNLDIFITKGTVEVIAVNIRSISSHSVFWNQAAFSKLWKEIIKPCQRDMGYREISNRSGMTDITKSKIVIAKSIENCITRYLIYERQAGQIQTIWG